MMPRAARISSTMRRLSGKRKYSLTVWLITPAVAGPGFRSLLSVASERDHGVVVVVDRVGFTFMPHWGQVPSARAC